MESQTELIRTITINAAAAKVWQVLTDPVFIRQWFSDTYVEMNTNWQPGSPITMQGDHGGLLFENRGTVLRSEPNRLLEYTFWSSVSEQPDEPENHSVITFALEQLENHTQLRFGQRNLNTYTIFKHSEMYWNVTLRLIKQLAER